MNKNENDIIKIIETTPEEAREKFKKVLDEIPIERKVYGCEDGSICCFHCVGKKTVVIGL